MKKTLIALAAVSLVIPAVLFAEPVEKNDLAGVWEVRISPTGAPPPPMRALAMFGKDGSFVGTHDRSVPPVPENWRLRLTWARHTADGSKRATEFRRRSMLPCGIKKA
jgi:hypothetical protein